MENAFFFNEKAVTNFDFNLMCVVHIILKSHY